MAAKQYENWAMPLKCNRATCDKRCGKLFHNWIERLRYFSANKACSRPEKIE